MAGDSVILSPSGTPFQTTHQGASTTLPDMENWLPESGSADADIRPDLPALIARSRDLTSNNGIADGIPDTFFDHVVGAKFRVQFTPDYEALGWTRREARTWAKAVEREFRWFSQNALAFDIEKQLNLTGFAGHVLSGALVSGGHIVLPRWRPGRVETKYGLCFQSIEVDRLSNPRNAPDSKTLAGGVEYDKSGLTPIALHLRDEHPGDALSFGGPANRWERVPLFSPWGRRQALHCYFKRRAAQSRGKPKLASALREFKTLARYHQAELNTAVSQALTTFFVETQMPPEMLGELFSTGRGYLDQRKKEMLSEQGARKSYSRADMDHNSLISMFPGDKIHNPKNTRPNDQFTDFCVQILRYVASALGISYETLTKDFTRTTYSSARAIMLSDMKRFLTIRKWLIDSYADPVVALWMEEAVDKGIVDAPDFYELMPAYLATNWQGAGRGWVDPEREAKAARIRVQAGFTSNAVEAAEYDQDWEAVQDQRVVELSRALRECAAEGLPEGAFYSVAGMEAPATDVLTTGIDRDAARLRPQAIDDEDADNE